MGGISVSAKTVNADLSKGDGTTGGATLTQKEGNTYTFSWTQQNQYVSIFAAFGGEEGKTLDWSDATYLNITADPNSGIGLGNAKFSVVIVANGKSFMRTPYSLGEKKLIVIGTDNDGNGFKDNWGGGNAMTKEDAKAITDIRIVGQEIASDATIASFDISVAYVTISPKATLTFGADGKATIDLSKAEAYDGATCKYEAGTGLTITSTGAGSYVKVDFDKAYDFTNMYEGRVTRSGGDDIYQSVTFPGSGHDNGFWASKDNPKFAGEIASGHYKAVTAICFNMQAAGTMTISDFTLTATNPMTITDAHSTLIETLPNYAVDNVTGEVTENGNMGCCYNTDAETFLGDGSGAPTKFINIEDYDELRVYTKKENNFRAFMFKETPKAGMTQAGHVDTFAPNIYPGIITYNEAGGYYAAKISDIKTLYNGQAKIIGIKSSSWGVKAVVSKITLYNKETTSEYDYTVSGQYSDAVSLDEIANSDACTIDCTGLTGADVKIGSKNPNCIIAVKKEGVVSAAKNLAVNGKIANLELTDGHSVKIPAGMTATTAKYTRTMTNTYGTIVLPFDAASDDNVEFYTISAMDENSITIEEVATLAAGTPAIIKKLSDNNVTITASNAALNGTINNTTGTVNMFGSYTQDEKIADENAYYILDNKFWQCNEYFYCDAFRAYFTKPAGAPAANCLSLKESFGNPTLVDIVTGNTANGIQGVYNTAGVKMQGLQKGINIVRLASGETKTVIIK